MIIFYSTQSLKTNYCFKTLTSRCCGAAIIKSALHAEGLQFKPGEQQAKVFKTNGSLFHQNFIQMISFQSTQPLKTNYSGKTLISRRCRHDVFEFSTSTANAEGHLLNPGRHQTKVLKTKIWYFFDQFYIQMISF